MRFIDFDLRCPTYLKPINTHPTSGEGQDGKLYGSGPDPIPPLRNKRERVGYARLLQETSGTLPGCAIQDSLEGCKDQLNLLQLWLSSGLFSERPEKYSDYSVTLTLANGCNPKNQLRGPFSMRYSQS